MQKVYVIEDDILLRDLITEALSHRQDLLMVGSCGDGRKGLDECLQLKPNMVILDVRLPGLNGVEVATQIKNELPQTKVLVFSGSFNLSTLRRVMMAKVHGIIEKGAGLVELEKAIDSLARGQTYYGPAIVQRLPELLTSPHDDQTLDSLTLREKEVLQLIGEGFTTKEIADKLNISARTADVHRTHIMQKLGVHNVAGLTRKAVLFGLVDASTYAP